MMREEQEPTRTGVERHGDNEVLEQHPAFGRVILHRVSSTPGASLFDSEIRHSGYIQLEIHEADRTRMLNRDWIHPGRTVTKIAMSEAQWAAMVSSFGDGGGTSCTIEYADHEAKPRLPFAPRLAQSQDETKLAARRIKDRIDAALAAVEERPTKANVRALRMAVDSAESNVEFAAKSLTEHTENVVQKARADIEAMVDQRAREVGLPEAQRPVLGLPAPE